MSWNGVRPVPLCPAMSSAEVDAWFAERGQPLDDAMQLVRRLIPRVELPGQVLVIARQGGFRKLADKVMKLPGAEVFLRDRT